VTQGSLLNFTISHIKGDMLALFGAASYAIFSVLGKKYKYPKFDSLPTI